MRISVRILILQCCLACYCHASHLKSRFSTFEYSLLPALTASSLILNFTDSPAQPHWTGGILLDDGARSTLRAHSRDTRDTAAVIGDVLLGAVTLYPFAVDALGVSLISRKDSDTAGQLSLIAAQSYLITGFLRLLTKVLVGRERPFQQECGADPNYEDGCGLGTSRASFFSGHASVSFTAAGLICSSHEAFDLPGGSVPCYVGLGLASTISLTRIVSDKHYLSDTLVGAAVGLLSGYFLPKWLHYGDDASNSVMISPTVAAQGWKVGLYLPF